MSSQTALAEIDASRIDPKQGETIEVICSPDPDHSQESGKSINSFITFNKHTYKLFPDDAGKLRCLMAVPADLSPGKYQIDYNKDHCSITVHDGQFPLQHLTLPKTKDNFNMSPGEEEAVNQAKAVLSDERLWKGSFDKPCKAKISAVFGIRRIVNGKLLKDYYHSGVDFAGNLGQPVTACADGTVVLAHKNFKLHGNIIALDHGQGVVTIYIHLQKIMVKEGDSVRAGQQIGAVGATGRANGPHLHFSLYVNKVAANPMPWFTKTF